MANGYFSFQRSPLPPPAPGSLFSLCLTSSAESTKLWFNLYRSPENAIDVQTMPDVIVLVASQFLPWSRLFSVSPCLRGENVAVPGPAMSAFTAIPARGRVECRARRHGCALAVAT